MGPQDFSALQSRKGRCWRMRETKELLLRLQELDDDIDRLKTEMESIPEKRRDLEGALNTYRAQMEQAKSESIDLAKERKMLEVDLESGQGKIDKFKHQLFQVKTNREYEALQHEITALEEKKSGLEDRILEIMDRSEKVSRKIAEADTMLKAESDRTANEQAELDKEEADLGQKIAIKADERTRLVVDMDQMLLKRYERIRESKGGLAVTTVNTGACGGCHRRIPPHEMQNLKKDARIIMCEGCGRILIWRWD
jgi:predicted  nucleic acid-binding Zn-ribbon protein